MSSVIHAIPSRRRLLRNLSAATVSKVAGAVVSVASVPILLALLGPAQYATWIVLAAVPVWLSMSDLGFGSVAASEMTLRAAAGDMRGAQSILHAAWAGLLLITGVAVLLLVTAASLAPWESWLGLAIPVPHLASIVIVLGFSSLLSLQAPLFYGLFRVRGRAEIPIAVSGLKPVLDLLFVCVAFSMFRTLLAAAAGLLAAQAAYLVGGTVWGLRTCPELKLGVRHATREDFSLCLRKGLAFCVLPTANALQLQGVLLVIHSALGLPAVLVFSTVRTMMRAAQHLLNLSSHTVLPEFGLLIGASQWGTAARLHATVLTFNVLAATGVAVLGVAFGPWFYGVWTSHQLAVDPALVAALALGVVANAWWFGALTILNAANLHNHAFAYLLASVGALALAYPASLQLGLVGTALSLLLVDAVVGPYVVRRACAAIHQTPAELLAASLGRRT
jgi:O-antigen/teichoic acid export membrane protein